MKGEGWGEPQNPFSTGNPRPTSRVFVAGFQKIGGRGVGPSGVGTESQNPRPSLQAPPEVFIGGGGGRHPADDGSKPQAHLA